jgi:hypothetical protein
MILPGIESSEKGPRGRRGGYFATSCGPGCLYRKPEAADVTPSGGARVAH